MKKRITGSIMAITGELPKMGKIRRIRIRVP